MSECFMHIIDRVDQMVMVVKRKPCPLGGKEVLLKAVA